MPSTTKVSPVSPVLPVITTSASSSSNVAPVFVNNGNITGLTAPVNGSSVHAIGSSLTGPIVSSVTSPTSRENSTVNSVSVSSSTASSQVNTNNNTHSGGKDTDSPLPKYKRDLVQKMKVLRQELQIMQPPTGHCRIDVSRDEIFEVSINNAI